jgi:UDP-N-acetylmuramoylalanine--D-glutamate ligase
VILIAGGYDKHIPYEVLGPEICKHVKFLVLTGATGEKIKDAVLQAEGEKPQIVQIEAFSDAVKTAAAAAKPGDTVLLSPASASFDRFKNFMERGNYFKELVQKL